MTGHLADMFLQALLTTIQEWPKDIYDISAVIVAVQAELEKSTSQDSAVLMECLAELCVISFITQSATVNV
jgi:hypothetical protein